MNSRDSSNCISLIGEQILVEYGHERSGTIVVKIEDSGIGISEESLQKLFSPFQQAHEKISTYYGGTGLGLWISKTIMEQYGGSINVTSS